MQTPLYIRPLTADERATLETGLRSASAFTVRRCQILLARAEQWAKASGCSLVRLRSTSTRTKAHAFYEHLGYTNIKTQYSFAKGVDAAGRDAVKRLVAVGALLISMIVLTTVLKRRFARNGIEAAAGEQQAADGSPAPRAKIQA